MSAHRFWMLGFDPYSGSSSTFRAIGTLVVASAPGGDHALAGAGISSSASYGGDTPDNMFDGSLTSEWVSYDTYNYIIFDLGAGNQVEIQEIRLATGENKIHQAPQHISVFSSDDGSIWKLVRVHTGFSLTAGYESAFDALPLPESQVFNRADDRFFVYNTEAHFGPVNTFIPRFGVMADALDGQTRATSKTPFSGSYYLRGSTTALGTPVARRVYLYDDRTGWLVRVYHTGETGEFVIDNISEGPWTVVGYDPTLEQNSVIYSHILAEPMPDLAG
jgi:hypothetical protein